jgi:predicted nuclease with TOPRIM domain
VIPTTNTEIARAAARADTVLCALVAALADPESCCGSVGN